MPKRSRLSVHDKKKLKSLISHLKEDVSEAKDGIRRDHSALMFLNKMVKKS